MQLEIAMLMMNPDKQIEALVDARKRTLTLIDGLSEAQLMGPCLPTINPLRWEIGHVAYFYEYWILRHYYGKSSLLKHVDDLFDSIHIEHADRWHLPLPDMRDTLRYMQAVCDQVCAYARSHPADERRSYLTQYAIFHEDMHTEAFTWTRQTLAYPAPSNMSKPTPTLHAADSHPGDAEIPGGYFELGAGSSEGFVFDNEKWAHSLEVQPFQIARTAVSNHEYLMFVEAGGYHQSEYWDAEGWTWRCEQSLDHPVYWRHTGHGWQLRQYDHWEDIPLRSAVIHVSWYEAQAWCRWAGRRLPSELEWEVAAAGDVAEDGQSLAACKRRYPWGNDAPTAERANFEGCVSGPISVSALPQGDSAFGCRQMLGNVWEWTASVFQPYPGFTPDMYQDYSQPLFGHTRVLRGGSYVTRARLMRNTLRNYFGPDRNDVFAGFRTCAL